MTACATPLNSSASLSQSNYPGARPNTEKACDRHQADENLLNDVGQSGSERTVITMLCWVSNAVLPYSSEAHSLHVIMTCILTLCRISYCICYNKPLVTRSFVARRLWIPWGVYPYPLVQQGILSKLPTQMKRGTFVYFPKIYRRVLKPRRHGRPLRYYKASRSVPLFFL